MEFLDHAVIQQFTLGGIAGRLFTAAESFSIPTSNGREFRFFHTLTNTCSYPFKKILTAPGGDVPSLWIWVCISLVTDSGKHLLTCSQEPMDFASLVLPARPGTDSDSTPPGCMKGWQCQHGPSVPAVPLGDAYIQWSSRTPVIFQVVVPVTLPSAISP